MPPVETAVAEAEAWQELRRCTPLQRGALGEGEGTGGGVGGDCGGGVGDDCGGGGRGLPAIPPPGLEGEGEGVGGVGLGDGDGLGEGEGEGLGEGDGLGDGEGLGRDGLGAGLASGSCGRQLLRAWPPACACAAD